MSINTVSGSSLQRDLVTALRQARAASAKPIDPTAFTATGEEADTTQATGGSSQASSAIATSALSNDLMASLLQLQSDFNQLGLQNGITAPGDSDNAADISATTGVAATDPSQASAGTTPLHHRHGHHDRPVADTDAAAQAGQSGGTETASAPAAAPTTGSASTTDIGDSLQSLLQQMTKAIAAYATGGPIGVAATALTSTAKA
ncbi:cell wall anchor protein [Methylobacterium sp. CM6257]